MGRVKDVKETVNLAIRFVKADPCFLCIHKNITKNVCFAGVKYKGTCKVYKYLKREFVKLREMEEEE